MLEVYFDDCFDLLNGKVKIPIAGFGSGAKSSGFTESTNRYAKKEGFGAKGMASVSVSNREEFLSVMRLIEATRTAKSHALNDRSSRSHCMVMLTKTSKSGTNQRTNKLTFVDLAGSERIKKTEVTNLKAEEAKNINTSLSALGRCINELSKSGSSGFIPYRDSALTMLMKESLAGNCSTSLIVTIAEGADMTHESVSSMRFGLSCGKIK